MFDNKRQSRKGESVKILMNLNKGLETMHIGLKMLEEGKRVVFYENQMVHLS